MIIDRFVFDQRTWEMTQKSNFILIKYYRNKNFTRIILKDIWEFNFFSS